MRLMARISASATLAVALSATASHAYKTDGIEYEVSCNSDGYVLTSKYPVTRMMTTPVDAEAVSGIEKIYMGKSCDAYHAVFGAGKWCRANGGFVAEFPNHTFGFGRQELICEGVDAHRGRCGCL